MDWFSSQKKNSEKVIELDLGAEVDAATPFPLLLQNELKAFLTFKPSTFVQGGVDDEFRTAIVEINGCLLTKFGYPNDEALGGHPLYEKGLTVYSICEVENSSWVKEIERQNRVSFPDRTDYSKFKHFVFGFHDSTFECIAREIKLELSIEPYHQILNSLVGRLWDN